MKRINQTLRLLAVTAFALGTLLSTAPAQAITVSISPTTQTVAVGGTASIDIIVSDLDDAVGGFSLTLTFNDTFLADDSLLNDPDATMGADFLDLSGGFAGGSVDLYFIADVLETEASLGASQGSSFTLATLTFTGIANGLSQLTLSDVILSNWDGTETLGGVQTQNGSICVSDTSCEHGVPEPGTLALLGLGLLGLSLSRRRRGA